MFNRHVATFLLLISSLAAPIAACGDDDDGTQISSGLPKSQKLSTLDDEDAKTACASFARSFETALPDAEFKKALCSQQGVIISLQAAVGGDVDGAVMACEAISSECQKDEPLEEGDAVEDVEFGFPDEESCEDAEVDDDFASCDATVGEYEACMNGVIAGLRQQLSQWNCELLRDDLDALPEFEPPSTDIDECKALQSKCPAVDPFGDDEEEQGS